jgi:gamma-glutamylcyclotransferase
MKYFAYGSNMSLPRLNHRVAGAERIGLAALPGHALRFHKVSQIDGSAKCDALFTGSAADTVFGALFELAAVDKCVLDRIEGLGAGYLDKAVRVSDARGTEHQAITYYATDTDPALRPYSWYLHHVVYGAIETGVPAPYLDALRAIDCVDDIDLKRDARERAIYRQSPERPVPRCASVGKPFGAAV